MQDVPWIFIVSTPRSGTNQIMFLLMGMSRVHAFSEPFSPFHPSYLAPSTLGRFARASGLELDNFTDPRLAEWIAAHRGKTIELLEQEAGKWSKANCLKVFQNHMGLDEFCRLLVEHPNSHFLFIERKPIDSFISFLKARAKQQWFGVDTTDHRATLIAEDFAAWHARHSRWFAATRAAVKGARRPMAEINYDEDVLVAEEETMRRLKRALALMGLDLDLSIAKRASLFVRRQINRLILAAGGRGIFAERVGLEKQDRGQSRESKVTNWDEFVAQLAQMPGGLAMLDRYFVEEPVSSSAPTAGEAKIA